MSYTSSEKTLDWVLQHPSQTGSKFRDSGKTYLLEVKIKFRFKFFKLGWFSISFIKIVS